MKYLARIASGVAAAALVITAISALPADAAKAKTKPAEPKTTAAETWLVKNLQDGLIPSSFGGYNYGPSIDAALSILAAKGKAADVKKIAKAVLTDEAKAYTDSDYCSNADFSYYSPAPCADKPADAHEYSGTSAGAAKALYLAEKTGTGNRAGLKTEVESLLAANGSIHDKTLVDGVLDTSGANDFASPLHQVYAAVGLKLAKSSKASVALKYLVGQQCSDGAFPASYNGCVADGSGDSLDTTSFAVWLLHDAGLAKANVSKATAWLVKQQAKGGAFGGEANSTGLAAQALHAVGKTAAAKKAATWLVALQVPKCPTGSPLADATGAIAYNAAALATARTAGWKAASDQWLYAAAQALPALAYAPKAKTKVTC